MKGRLEPGKIDGSEAIVRWNLLPFFFFFFFP